MKISDTDDEQYGLWFAVKRSIRYHERRQGFFLLMHQITSGLTILLAGSVLFDLAKTGDNPWWMNTIAVVSALLAAWDIVINYSSKAELHRSLRNRWIEMEESIVAGDNSPEAWEKHTINRLKIERDEPPIYRALDALCHNEVMVAEGNKKGAPGWFEVCFFQRITSQIFRWQNIAAVE